MGTTVIEPGTALGRHSSAVRHCLQNGGLLQHYRHNINELFPAIQLMKNKGREYNHLTPVLFRFHIGSYQRLIKSTFSPHKRGLNVDLTWTCYNEGMERVRPGPGLIPGLNARNTVEKHKRIERGRVRNLPVKRGF